MSTESFLLREPLLGRDSRFAGYSLRASDPASGTPVRQLFAANAAGRHLGGLCILEDIGPAMDDAGSEPPQGLVVSLRPQAADRIAVLKQRRLATCVRVDSATQDFPAALAAVDFVWLDLGPGDVVKNVAKVAQRLPGKRIAAGIATRDGFEDSKEAGAQFFLGNWYTKVAGTPAKAVAPAQATIVELINLTQAEAPAPKIEQVLKRDATLSFRLLRYINSAGFGLSCEIQSFRHAVTILGYQNLTKWLSLLLATAGNSPAAPVLTREAATRGRLMELVGEGFVAPEERDNLFIVGVFSLLPPILQIPMEQLLGQLNLAESVGDALLSRSGLYGPILKLTESLEGADPSACAAAAAQLQFSSAQANRFHLEALAWADQIAA